MRLNEILTESTSLDSSIRSIVSNGHTIAMVFDNLAYSAKKWVDNNGALDGFQLQEAGVGSRWYNEFYFNRMNSDLYDLSKQVGGHGASLKAFLSQNAKSIKNISRNLPDVLIDLGRKIGRKDLTEFATGWKNNFAEYERKLASLASSADSEDDYTPQPTKAKDNTLGTQNSQAEQLVAAILRDLPKHIAGDIRNAIARNPNKLLALQQELSKRGIKL